MLLCWFGGLCSATDTVLVLKGPMACYFMDAYICVSGPLIQYLKKLSLGAELATTSQPHNELSTNVPFLEAGPGGGWGCGPEQLVATVPWLVFTVDVSQWRGAHSF